MVKLGGGDEPQMLNMHMDFLEEMHYGVELVAKAIKNKSECNNSVMLRVEPMYENRANELVGGTVFG